MLAHPQLGPRRRAIRRRRRNRTPGHAVLALVRPSLDRKGQADAPGERGEQSVGEPDVRVGLGQHQRDAPQHGRDAGGPGHVAPAAEHNVGPLGAQDPQRAECRPQRQQTGSQRRQRVAAIEAAHGDRVHLVAGGGHQFGLGTLAAHPHHLGPRARSSSATASAGTTWPAVPPAAMRTRVIGGGTIVLGGSGGATLAGEPGCRG